MLIFTLSSLADSSVTVRNVEEVNGTIEARQGNTPIHSHSRLRIQFFLPDIRASRPNTVILQDRLHLLRSVLAENKELVIGPAFTLLPQLFSLPYFIASLTLRCQNLQGTGLRHLLTVSYFTTFIPPLMSFQLYISPSSFYSKEWHATSIVTWLMAFKQHEQAIVH